MFMSPQNSYVEIPTPNVIVLDGAFERWLGEESEALVRGFGTLIKETQRVHPFSITEDKVRS